GSGLLAGCQGAPSPAPEVTTDGWRVVERLGDARFLAPGASGWSPAIPATTLPSGSEVATGTGGRVILARNGDHVSAGPASRFSLPLAGPGAILEQRAGGLRYRIAAAPPQVMVVETPFLSIEVRGTVFDVTVTATATEVSVEQGQIRIVTPDRRRQIELESGQSAYAGGPAGDNLAFRRGQGAPLESVEAIVLPAMRPKAGVSEGRPPAMPGTIEGGAANLSGTAASHATVPIATAVAAASSPDRVAAMRSRRTERSASVTGPRDSRAVSVDAVAAPASIDDLSAAEGDPVPPGGGDAGSTAGPRPASNYATKPRPGAGGRPLFDRLTEGMVDAVPAARPSQEQPADAHAR
ncbi:MAG TPA: FecR domain-containing protein, partial [Geminicoccaceae bacterium]|nr:FecR domain-containing protein [Geminicoccaceae bacterium]